MGNIKGEILDGFIDFINEATRVSNANGFIKPIVKKPRKWDKKLLEPFVEKVPLHDEKSNIDESLEERVKNILREAKKKKEMGEDLAVWFGKKKKPKGSKQPKGPWVNICRKDKDGKHPPCGRPDSDSKGYPKCRAAGVAGKMTDAQKKSACSQKRSAEKKSPKSGTGNKPTMTSYKPKKK